MTTSQNVFIDAATNESKFDIIRDTTGGIDDKNWLNRFCKDATTNVSEISNLANFCQDTIYYCEAAEDHKLILHRGEKSGEIIATGVLCLEKEGYTDIHFTEPKLTISLEHKHQILPFLHVKNYFEYNGKKYYWKDNQELLDEDNNLLLAAFQSVWLEGQSHRIGQLIVKADGQDMRDIVVFTSLIVQERADEHTAVTNFNEYLSDCGRPNWLDNRR